VNAGLKVRVEILLGDDFKRKKVLFGRALLKDKVISQVTDA
jgi:hypothetical protein